MAKKIKINKLDKLFSDFIRARDGYKCVFCGRQFDPDEPYGLQGLDCSHFWGRTCKELRYEPDNADALCTGCHMKHEGSKQGFYAKWKCRQLGDKRYAEMEEIYYKSFVTPMKWGEYEKKQKLAELKTWPS